MATGCEELTHWKRPSCWERLKVGGEGDDGGWEGWMASPAQWTWVEQALGVGNVQGSMACYSPWGRKVSDRTERLNWTGLYGNLLIYLVCFTFSISYSVLPFHLVYVLQFLHHFFKCTSLPGKSHGLGSPVSYSLWGHKESDTTERFHFHFHSSLYQTW